MTEREICHSYHNAKHKAQQIQILADLNGINILEILNILARNGEKLPETTLNKLYAKLDRIETQIREKEWEYKAIVAVLKGGNMNKEEENGQRTESIYRQRKAGSVSV